jgi:hypothetical protein
MDDDLLSVKTETNTILNNYLSQLNEIGKPQSINLMTPSLLWSNHGNILFSQRNIECTYSLAKSCDLGIAKVN